MSADQRFDLDRFVKAQEQTYATALAELKHGRKQSHWIWFVLPQLRGLGFSQMSHTYGITGLAEAKAYLDDPVLGPRLVECVQTILSHAGRSAQDILGNIDARKFQSCLTLFSLVDPGASVFSQALQQFFGGQADANTLHMVGP